MENPQPGMRVLVPLGTKQMVGIVLREHVEPISDSIRLRDVIMALDEQPAVNSAQLAPEIIYPTFLPFLDYFHILINLILLLFPSFSYIHNFLII